MHTSLGLCALASACMCVSVGLCRCTVTALWPDMALLELNGGRVAIEFQLCHVAACLEQRLHMPVLDIAASIWKGCSCWRCSMRIMRQVDPGKGALGE